MNIKTKFEIGQEVWYITQENSIESFIIEDYTITKNDKINLEISGNEIGYIDEEECYKNKEICKEELIKKIEKM